MSSVNTILCFLLVIAVHSSSSIWSLLKIKNPACPTSVFVSKSQFKIKMLFCVS